MRRKDRQGEEPEESSTTPEQRRITPVDIQQKEFRLAFRGYNEAEVDQFLDDLTEELARLYAENKRLREEVDFKRTERLDSLPPGEADGLIRQAREEAARIMADARARASTITSGGQGGTALLGPFLAREREFLQALAGLIQGHADGVKEGIKKAREDLAPAQAQAPAQVQEAAITDDAEDLTQVASPTVSEPPPPNPPAQEPEAGSPAGGMVETWHSGERIMDLTEDPVDVERRPQPEPVSADDREDRSIREFFWGED